LPISSGLDQTDQQPSTLGTVKTRCSKLVRFHSARAFEQPIGGEDGFTLIELLVVRAVIQRRHGGKWNVLFCDGHVESLTTAHLFDTRKASVRMRWNNDNLPDH